MARSALKYVIIASLLIVLIVISHIPVVLAGSSGEDLEKVKGDIRKFLELTVSTVQQYIKEGKYVALNNYFGEKVYVISTTFLNPDMSANSTDSDGDGLYDDEERSLGTDPRKFDTDGDGLPDGFEAGYALYAFYNGLLDTGRGPLVILVFRVPIAEYSSIYGKSVYDAERSKGFFKGGMLNPLKSDTDGDGLSDLYEIVATHSIQELVNNLYVYGCHPKYSDIAEIASAFHIKIPDPKEKTAGFYCVFGGPVLNPFVGVTLKDLERGHTIYGRILLVGGPYFVESRGQAYYQALKTAGSRWFNNPSLSPEEVRFGPLEMRTDPTLPDTDGDGLSDGVEIFSTGTAPYVKDTDGDGLTDAQEISIGTIPVAWDVDQDGLGDSEEIQLGTNPFAKDTDSDGLSDDFELQLGTDPANPDTDGDGLLDKTDYLNADPLNPDTDGDGVNDLVEYMSHSNPRVTDTDGDGLSDYEEIFKYNTNPCAGDSDGDELSDSKEIQLGTDPANPDTDEDGLPDNREIAYGTDPTSPDTDGDGLLDSEEIRGVDCECLVYDYAQSKYVVYKAFRESDPLKQDSDGDGLSDYEEVMMCLNPRNPDTDGDGLSDPQDPCPYYRDADGDGLKDPDELSKGTSPFANDTDGDGITDDCDNSLDISREVVEKQVEENKEKEVKENKIVFKLDASSTNTSSIKVKLDEKRLHHAFNVVTKLDFTLLPKKDEEGNYLPQPVMVEIRLKPELSVNGDKYVLKKASVGGTDAEVRVENGEVIVRLTHKYFYIASFLDKPFYKGRFREKISVSLVFENENSEDKKQKTATGIITLVFYDKRPPEILGGEPFWFKDRGRLYLVVCRASKITVMAPGLLLDDSKDKLEIDVPKSMYWEFRKKIQLKPKDIILGSKEEAKIVDMPEVEFGEVEEGSKLAVMKVSVEAVEKGQETGYYLAQLSMVKSTKAKIVYGALATYTVVETVVGGFKEIIPKTEVGAEGGGEGGGGGESGGGKGGKVSGLVNYVVDKIKESAVDWVKEKMEEYAKKSEMEARKTVTTYKIVIKACNSYGCVTESVLVKGVGYE